jgi:hypothetical protein
MKIPAALGVLCVGSSSSFFTSATIMEGVINSRQSTTLMRRLLFCALLGALLGGVLTATSFTLMAVLDGARPTEAAGFGAAVGVAGGFFGMLAGFAVGIGNLGAVGGAVAGLLATAAAVAFYVLVFGEPTRLVYFLRESVVVWLVLGLPMVLSGSLTALLKNRLNRPL